MKKLIWMLLAALLLGESVLAEEIKQFAYYESAYPHCAVYEITHSETGAVSYETNPREQAPWASHFMPYRWETKLPYQIVEKRFSNLPLIGWVEQEVYPELNVTKEEILRPGGCERVTKQYQLFGYGGFRIVGENRVADAKSVYATYPGKIPAPDWELLSAENLSRTDKNGKYTITDRMITAQFPLFDSAYLTGRNYAKGGELVIDVAKEIIDGADPCQFDQSVLQPSTRERSVVWKLTYENKEPYRQYEVLCLDGILLDGRVENGVKLPFISRYTGGFGKTEEPAPTYQSAEIYAFTYHWISENPLNWGDYTITKEKFQEDIRYLYENDFYFATASELYRMKGCYPKEKIALITFDDGYASCYTEALPVLEQYGAKATMFVVGSYLDTEDYLSKEQLKLLSQSPQIEIGNHSHTLHNLPRKDVLTLYQNEIDSALSDYYRNEAMITEITGKTVTSLSFPYGLYTKQLEQCLKDHGYEVTFSTYAKNNHNTQMKAPLNRLNRSFYTPADILIQQFQ